MNLPEVIYESSHICPVTSVKQVSKSQVSSLRFKVKSYFITKTTELNDLIQSNIYLLLPKSQFTKYSLGMADRDREHGMTDTHLSRDSLNN